MQVDIDKVVHVHLVGPLTELLTKVDPELYTKYLVKKKGRLLCTCNWEGIVQDLINVDGMSIKCSNIP